MNWTYKGKNVTSPPPGWYGFVYRIIDEKGKVYYGKKAFSHKRKTKLSKKLRRETGKRVRIDQKDSGWQAYFGSCKPLQEHIKARGGTQGFKREILKFCKDKMSLSYWETYYLFKEQVLFKDTWNGHVLRFFKGRIHK